MLKIFFAEDNPKRPVAKFFKGPLSDTGIDHKFVVVDDEPEGSAMFGDGDIILAMGNKMLKYYRDAGMVKKNLSLNKLRNQVHLLDYGSAATGGHVPLIIPTIFSYDPSLILIDIMKEPDIQWDIKFALRYITTGSDKPVLGEYTYVTDFGDNILDVYAAKDKLLASLDLETIGLDEFAPEARIVTVQVTTQQGRTSVYRVPESGKPSKEVLEQIQVLCTDPKIKLTGANLKFDARWIKRHFGFWITNQTFDTSLVGACMNENRGNSLNLHAKLYTNLGGYDDDFDRLHDKSRMDLAIIDDPKGFLTYAGGDTDACYQVTKPLRQELMRDKPLANFYVKLLQPAAKAFAIMEHRGVVVDRQRYEELKVEVDEHITDLNAQILSLFPWKLQARYSDNLKLTRPALLRDFMFSDYGLDLEPQMFTAKAEDPSTALEHLEMFGDVSDAAEFIGLMRQYRSATKTMSTYIDGFMKHLRSDGKFHPAYRMFRGDYGGTSDEGAVTGRTSATDPAWQTIPKHTSWAKPLRTVYTPPPGMAILKLDYSQGELRVTACVANETTMIQTYKAGIDLHLRTGAMVNHLTLDEALELKAKGDPMIKQIRQGGKAGNFGLIYGMQPAGFQSYAQSSFGVELQLSEAEKFRNDFFIEYPRLVTWHEDSIAVARRDGQIRSPLGRVRHLPMIHSRDNGIRSKQERQSINSPIQCTLSDLGLLAIAELSRIYPSLWMFSFTHDEVAAYVPEDQITEWAIKIRDVMENLPLKEYFGWDPALKFLADAEASTVNMAVCEELKLAA